MGEKQVPFSQKILNSLSQDSIEAATFEELIFFLTTLMQVRKNEDDTTVVDNISQKLKSIVESNGTKFSPN